MTYSITKATSLGEGSIATILLKDLRFDINTKTYKKGYTALHLNALRDQVAFCSRMLKHKEIDVEARTHRSETALFLAAKHNNAAFVEKLILEDKRCDVNALDNKGWTPLHAALFLRNQR